MNERNTPSIKASFSVAKALCGVIPGGGCLYRPGFISSLLRFDTTDAMSGGGQRNAARSEFDGGESGDRS
jgi:hypothetical protein